MLKFNHTTSFMEKTIWIPSGVSVHGRSGSPVFPAAAPTSAHTERAASDAGGCPLAAAIHNEGALPFFSRPI